LVAPNLIIRCIFQSILLIHFIFLHIMKCKFDECLIVQVAEKLSLIEQQKMETERQQKVQYLPTFTPQINESLFWVIMFPFYPICWHIVYILHWQCTLIKSIYYIPLQLAEEEEIRRLRKELIPKAQPMPYFDRPFIPRRYWLINITMNNLYIILAVSLAYHFEIRISHSYSMTQLLILVIRS
jgi:hypothetical protein